MRSRPAQRAVKPANSSARTSTRLLQALALAGGIGPLDDRDVVVALTGDGCAAWVSCSLTVKSRTLFGQHVAVAGQALVLRLELGQAQLTFGDLGDLVARVWDELLQGGDLGGQLDAVGLQGLVDRIDPGAGASRRPGRGPRRSHAPGRDLDVQRPSPARRRAVAAQEPRPLHLQVGQLVLGRVVDVVIEADLRATWPAWASSAASRAWLLLELGVGSVFLLFQRRLQLASAGLLGLEVADIVAAEEVLDRPRRPVPAAARTNGAGPPAARSGSSRMVRR